MKKLLIVILIFLVLTFCTKYIRLGKIEPASEYLHKEMIIFTKDGQIIKMRIYKVEQGKLFGVEKKENKHEILISEIRQLTLEKKHNTLETFLFLGAISTAILFIIFSLSFKVS